jgi:hypothetical protein
MSRKRKRNGSEQTHGAAGSGAESRRKTASGGFRAFSQRADGARGTTGTQGLDDNRVIAGKDITVREARIMLSSEGGELTVRELVVEVLWALVFSATLAWAIAVGKATLWHLLVPMAGELVVYLAAVPFLSLFFRHPELRKVSFQCLRSVAIYLAVVVVTIIVRSRLASVSFVDQWNTDMTLVWNWIFTTHMQWPILVAALHMIRNTTRSAQHLISHGPPFLGPGMGCGMRIAVLILAAVIVPAFGMVILSMLQDVGWKLDKHVSTTTALAWALWACLLIAELCLLWFRWDIQNKLRKRGHSTSAGHSGKS